MYRFTRIDYDGLKEMFDKDFRVLMIFYEQRKSKYDFKFALYSLCMKLWFQWILKDEICL